MKENSIKKEQSSIEEDIERLKLCSTNQCYICGRYEKEECILERNRCEQHILSDYKRVLEMNEVLLKENEELKISNKEIDKECSRLEKKEFELINENEHYEDLIYALKTYYDITEEDLEKCIKNDI